VTATVPGVATPANFSLTNVGAPASITATAGTPQSTIVNTTFATALKATVRDGNNNPVPGVTVTFTAPSTGASARFGGSATSVTGVTDGNGVATVAPRANNTAGSYTVTASVTGVATPATFSLTNTRRQ
jgi:adhesin/invasin